MKLFPMRQEGTYNNTSKILINKTNKGNRQKSVNKKKKKLKNRQSYLHHSINNKSDKNDLLL